MSCILQDATASVAIATDANRLSNQSNATKRQGVKQMSFLCSLEKKRKKGGFLTRRRKKTVEKYRFVHIN